MKIRLHYSATSKYSCCDDRSMHSKNPGTFSPVSSPWQQLEADILAKCGKKASDSNDIGMEDPTYNRSFFQSIHLSKNKTLFKKPLLVLFS